MIAWDVPDYNTYYSRLHGNSDAYYAAMERSYRGMLAHNLPRNRNVRILDVGCGTGFLLHALRCAGYGNCQGVDVDRSQVEVAKSRSLPVDQVAADSVGAWLLERPGLFDVIFLMDVLEHVPKAGQIGLLRAIYRALRPGGRLICQVPNAMWPLACVNRYVDWTHECLFTLESLSFVLEGAGFQVQQVRNGHDRPSPPRGFLRNAAMGAARMTMQGVLYGAWRVVTIAFWGSMGLRHPLRANLLAVAAAAA